MGTKWKGWTANTGIKAISYILLPVLIFVWISSFYSWAEDWEQDPAVDMHLLFASFENDNYFYDMYMNGARWDAEAILKYQDEEAIRSMKYLQWIDQDGRTYKISDQVGDGAEVEQTNPTATHTPPSDVQEVPEFDEHVDVPAVELPVIDQGDVPKSSEDIVDELLSVTGGKVTQATVYSSDHPPQTRIISEDPSKGRIIIEHPDGSRTIEFIEQQEQQKMEYRLMSAIDGRRWGYVHDTRLINPETAELVQMAIGEQLKDFRYVKQQLESRKGLVYYITDGQHVFSNAEQQNEEYFKSQPVYAIVRNGEISDYSKQGRDTYDRMYNYDWERTQVENGSKEQTIYLAFEQDYVERQTAAWKQMQEEMRLQGLLVAIITLMVLIVFIIILMGAGRSRSDHGQGVHFNAFDKIHLDVGLILVIIIEAIVIAVMAEVFESMQRYGSESIIYWGFAVFAFGVSVPALWWIVNFSKRVKDGSVMRHTLCYWIINKLCVKTWNFCSKLWAGVAITVKVIVIVTGIFFAMLISSEEPFMALVFSAIILVLASLWANRLQQVVKGARAASNGKYDQPISVTGGELGKIASSINHISKGINQAVDEKLKSERLKTELITNVSHDIRTPLTSIITYTDLLKNEGLDHEKAPEYLNVLIQKSQRLKTLTDELFEASKAATGNVEVHIKELDICALIRQCLGELHEQVQASGLDFRLNLPEKAMVYGDGKLIWRVMENLISNVFKYAQRQSRVYIDVIQGVNEYKLIIKNISDAPLNVDPPELMERFKRGDSARAGEGSGLGLSIVQSFVQVQGGKFLLDIDGDLFKATVTLPAAQPKESDTDSGDYHQSEQFDQQQGFAERLKESQIVQYVKKNLGMKREK